MKNLTKKLIGIAGVLAMAVPNSVNALDANKVNPLPPPLVKRYSPIQKNVDALDIKNKGEVIINGAGDVHLSDSYFVNGHFNMGGDFSDFDGDGILDMVSWQYTPKDEGNIVLMTHRDGLNSTRAFKRGMRISDYFNEFSKYSCRWDLSNPEFYGDCTDLGLGKELTTSDLDALSNFQGHFSDETVDHFNMSEIEGAESSSLGTGPSAQAGRGGFE